MWCLWVLVIMWWCGVGLMWFDLNVVNVVLVGAGDNVMVWCRANVV